MGRQKNGAAKKWDGKKMERYPLAFIFLPSNFFAQFRISRQRHHQQPSRKLLDKAIVYAWCGPLATFPFSHIA